MDVLGRHVSFEDVLTTSTVTFGTGIKTNGSKHIA